MSSTTTITDVRTYPVRVALRFPFVTSLRTATHAESLLVSVGDSEGNRGWGESPQVYRVTGESVVGARACVAGPLADAVLHLPADDLGGSTAAVAAAVHANSSAKAAVDVALHDLAATRLGVPLARLLGAPASRMSVQTDMTLSSGDPAGLAATACERVADGFRTLKVKVGSDADGDVARVRAVADAVGDGVTIRLDANQGWTSKQAVRVMTTLEGAGVPIEFVEQPVPAHDLAGLAFVTARIATPVLADESVYGLLDLVRLLDLRAADMVNIKLAKCGGLGQAAAMIELAHAAGIATMVGSMMETHVGVGAAASVMAAQGAPASAGSWTMPDLDAAWWLTRSPVAGGPRYDGDRILLPDLPGQGITGLVADPTSTGEESA
jgi:L-Ala-D/L-Glu epimerase / N-acetyl-D-glutamate racemase